MTALKITYGPNPIFSAVAKTVTDFDDELEALTQNMVDTLSVEKAVGIGANMVGVLKRIIVIDLREENHPLILINPEITYKSDDTQTFEEASVCFPGISAQITRPRKITLTYQDCNGSQQQMTAQDYLATVIQHEFDYLNGQIFLDYLSPVKRKMLIRKTRKFQSIQSKRPD